MEQSSMQFSSTLAPEVFQRHAAALRALAGALLRERADAEDALQDTWVAYLESPPTRGGSLGGWLATVLRRRAANRRRADARRSNHERASHKPHSFDPREAQEREETLHAVVAAVSALDEPLKHVVLLRYFEGLAPRDVAERLGLAPAVVYDRLHRVHEQLRKKLERQYGSKRAVGFALSALAGEDASAAATPTHTTPRAPWFASPIFVGSAATLFVVALVAVGREWIRRSESTHAGGAAVAALVAPPRVESRDPAATPVDSAQNARDSREPVGGEANELRGRSFPLPTFEYELEVTVLDAFDRTRAHQPIYAAPAGGTLNLVGRTDVDGRCKLPMRGWTESAELDLALGDESDGSVRRIALRAGAQTMAIRSALHEFVTMRVGVELLNVDQASKSLHVRDLPSGELEPATSNVVDQIAEQSSQAIRSGPPAPRDETGRITFIEPRLVRAERERDDEPPQAEGADEFEFLESIQGDPEFFIDETEGSESTAAAHGALVGTVFDDSGAALAGARVSLRRADEGEWNVATTNERGEYAFEALTPGDFVVQAGGGDVARELGRVSIAIDERARWDAQLERGEVLEGVLGDSKHEALAGWIVEAEGREGADFARTDAQGRFEIPNAPRGSLRLLAKPQALPGAPAICVASTVQAGRGSRRYQLAQTNANTLGELRIKVVNGERDASRSCEVRVWRVDSERGIVAPWIESRSGRDTARVLLLAGEHRVEVLVAGREPHVLRSVFVDAGAVHKLTVDALAPGARVNFIASSDPKLSNAMVLLRTGESFDALASFPHDKAFELRFGNYSLWHAFESRWLADLAPEAGVALEVELDSANRR